MRVVTASPIQERDRAPALQNAAPTTLRSRTSARFWSAPPLRRFSGARPTCETPRALTHRLAISKAGQGSRTPRRWRDHHALPNLRQVLECAAPAALFRRAPDLRDAPSFNSSPRHFESGTELPHSKTLARPLCAPEPPPGFGVRRPC